MYIIKGRSVKGGLFYLLSKIKWGDFIKIRRYGNFNHITRTKMDIRGYEYKTNEELLNYEFCSEGPNGKIKKVVRFTLRNANGYHILILRSEIGILQKLKWMI